MERTFLPDNDPYVELIEFARAKKPIALATIIETAGSTPQVPGSSALFAADGLVCGTIGGGSVEGRVGRQALWALKKKQALVRAFDLAHELSDEGDGVCGGRLKVLIDADPGRHVQAFKDLRRAAKSRRPGVLVTVIETTVSVRIDSWENAPGKEGRDGGIFPPDRWKETPSKRFLPRVSGRVKKISRSWLSGAYRPPDLRRAGLDGLDDDIRAAFRSGRPALTRHKTGWHFVEPHLPPPRLVIVGAGHVGRALARLGKFLNFEVVVLDDRAEFANARRFPEADRVLVADINKTLRAFPVSADTHIVIVTRGHRQDEGALRACIKRRAGYLGMIGSARKVDLVKARFLERGWCTAAEWACVRTPIGLPIGSKTVEEIAVSIAAELVLVRRKIQGHEPNF
ncbi:MAG: XdhC family protein [Candidatus Aminicenantes bacterium]|nr:XdhC family protein [Candidatus Aminicenantes bacterium]